MAVQVDDPATTTPMATAEVSHEEETEMAADKDAETSTLDEGSPELFGKKEALPMLLLDDMQKRTSKDVSNALKVLKTSLSDKNEDNEAYAEEACLLGAPSVVILVMKKWAHKASVQKYACDCVKMLLCHQRIAIIKAKGMEVVLSTMERFPDNDEIQQRGSAALFNFFANFTSRPEEEQAFLRPFVTDLGGLVVLVKAMEQFPENTKLQQYCCGIFSNFAPIEDFHQAMKVTGALSAVAKAHENHPDDHSIKKRARRTMKLVLGSHS